MKTKKRILAVLLTVAALISMTGFVANAATKATAITFSKTSDAKVRVGYAITRTAVTTPEGLAVTYTSSDKTIATVNENGKVVGRKPGKAVITASAGGLKTSYNVTVIKANSAIASSIAKEVFAGVTITVNDTKTPATYSGGTDWPITTYYFFSADNKKLGSISGQAMNAIMNKYRVNNNGSWDAPGNNGDWSKWFADMFNEYRGLSKDDVKKAESDLLDEYRYEVIRLTNIEREKAGLPAFEISDRAMKNAQMRAEELAVLYSHTRPDGSSGFIENIARRQSSPEEVVKDWMNSSGHRKNIMETVQTHIGVGCYKDNVGTMHWVQVFDCNPEYYSE